MTPSGLLIDLDDTLYSYASAEERGREALLGAVAVDLSIPREEAVRLYALARESVKARLGKRGASHSRLLYLLELAHCSHKGARALSRVRSWERLFWQAYLHEAELAPGARALLAGFRERGGKTAIVTDLVAEVQLWKVEAFGLFDLVDAVVVSEEVEEDKPSLELFELAIERIGVRREACVVVGDSDERDGAGARALGVRFYLVGESGMSLEDVGRALAA